MIISFGALALSVVAGLAVHLFFKFISRRSGEVVNELGEQYSAYLSVSDFLSEGRRRRVFYAIFRQVPPLVICMLLCGVLNKAFPGLGVLPYLLLSVTIAHSFSTFRVLFRNGPTVAEKIIHSFNLAVSLLLAGLVSLFDGTDIIRKTTPSIEGIVDNVWSSLFVSLIVVGYFESARKERPSYAQERRNIERDFVQRSFARLHAKYNHSVDTCIGADKRLLGALWAILVFEDMNRPSWIRFFERLLVRLPGIELTVGVAQFRSSKALSDHESIILTGRSLEAHIRDQPGFGDSLQLVKSAIYHHNPSNKYVDDVLAVYNQLPANAHVYVTT